MALAWRLSWALVIMARQPPLNKAAKLASKIGAMVAMRFLHTMVRVRDVEQSLDFYCKKLGLVEMRRKDVPQGRFTLIFLAAPKDKDSSLAAMAPELELTFNWDPEDYDYGRNFGHLAYKVDNIYDTCQRLMDAGVVINRPPRDGRMAFIKSPDNISIELLQEGDSLPPAEPWLSMENTGSW
jgi:lactoylglutathione lyase